jgi:ribokinase
MRVAAVAFFQLARSAAELVVTARRRAALLASGARADVAVGSALDPREACALADFPLAAGPGALVLTEGALGGRAETTGGVQQFPAPAAVARGGGAYGAGDSFAAR